MTGIVRVGDRWAPLPADNPTQYVPTVEALAAAQAWLDEIDRAHAVTCRRCALCGQLTLSVDRFGLCSKVSVPHENWRRDVRADARAGNRPGARRPRRVKEPV